MNTKNIIAGATLAILTACAPATRTPPPTCVNEKHVFCGERSEVSQRAVSGISARVTPPEPVEQTSKGPV